MTLMQVIKNKINSLLENPNKEMRFHIKFESAITPAMIVSMPEAAVLVSVMHGDNAASQHMFETEKLVITTGDLVHSIEMLTDFVTEDMSDRYAIFPKARQLIDILTTADKHQCAVEIVDEEVCECGLTSLATMLTREVHEIHFENH